MLIGYARVSTQDQDLSLQRDALIAAGVDEEAIYEDRRSGADTERPGLDACFKALRAGDVLVVWRLDRLGRSLKHLVSLVEDLDQRGIGLKCLTGAPVDTTSPAGRLVFQIFSALAEFERELIRERVVAGLASARARGRLGGRPTSMTTAKVKLAQAALARSAEGDPDAPTVGQVAKELGVSRSTLTRYVYEDGRLKARAERLIAEERSGRRKGRRED